MFKPYYRLTKPGIIYGNLLTTGAGFFLASSDDSIDFGILLATLTGVGLVMASACVFNNYLDREIDARMSRTKKRALVTGKISTVNALLYAAALGVLGFTLLATYTNYLTVTLGLVAMFFYVVVYGYAKRHTVHGTLVGTIPGALPPVAGYTAVSGQFELGAAILFLILVFWQMPHFYAIAIFRMKDYAAAGIPVLPLKKGMYPTKVQMVGYCIAFTAACLVLTAFGYTSYVFAILMLLIGLRWLRLIVKGFRSHDEKLWARKVFFFSLLVLLSVSTLITIDSLV